MTKSIFTKRYARFRLMLVEARLSARLTQAELAKRIARPQSFVSKFERGERRLDVVEFLDVAEALDVNAADFLASLARRKRNAL